MGLEVIRDSDLEKVFRRLSASAPDALADSLEESCEPVRTRAKQLAPRQAPGEDEHPEKPALADSIITVVEKRHGEVEASTGPSHPDGAHGVLMEGGHRVTTHEGEATGAYVPAKRFMAPAIDETMAQQKAAFNNTLAAHMRRAGA